MSVSIIFFIRMRYLFCLDIKGSLTHNWFIFFGLIINEKSVFTKASFFSSGDALLFTAATFFSVFHNLFVKMLMACSAYVMLIRISFPLLHLGHSGMSLPYFLSIRWLTGICTFGGKVLGRKTILSNNNNNELLIINLATVPADRNSNSSPA